MAMVRTRRLAVGKLVTLQDTPPRSSVRAGGVVYTVPAGIRAIVREVILWSTEGTGGVGYEVVAHLSGSAVAGVLFNFTPQAGSPSNSVQASLDAVLEEGDALSIWTTAADVWFYITGAHLVLLP